MNLSVVVPAYNESQGIKYFLTELKSVLEKSNLLYEVIIVNDGSTDSTEERILDFAWQELKLINLVSNSGHMSALEAGLATAVGELVVTMDADLQHPPLVILDMIELQKKTGADAVIGIRTREIDSSRLRQHLSAFFYRFLSGISKIEIHNDAADFRLMTNKVVRTLNSLPEISKVYRFLIGALGFKISKIDYISPKREYGETKYSGKHLWRLAITSVIGFSTFPLTAIFVGGSLVFAMSLSYLLFILVNFNESTGVQGWTSVMAAILVLSSVQIISLGIIGRYLSQVLLEVRRRPNFIVRTEELE